MDTPATTHLHDLIKLEKEARAFGFDWPDQNMILDQGLSECEEIREAIAKGESSQRIQEEIGDLLHTAISLCVFSGFDVEETVRKVNEKFGARMTIVKNLAQERGLKTLKGQSFAFILELWAEAKNRLHKDGTR